jgi:hypothetical protein
MFVTGTVDVKIPFKGIDAGFPIHAERKNSGRLEF